MIKEIIQKGKGKIAFSQAKFITEGK